MASSTIDRIDGVEIRQVEPGTVIEHHGCKLTVSDKCAVRVGGVIYATPAHFRAILKAAAVK